MKADWLLVASTTPMHQIITPIWKVSDCDWEFGIAYPPYAHTGSKYTLTSPHGMPVGPALSGHQTSSTPFLAKPLVDAIPGMSVQTIKPGA